MTGSKLLGDTVTLAHGGGGKAMRALIDDLLVSEFGNQWLTPLEDQARIALGPLTRQGDRLAFTTDSYVVDPLFFPGADIGRLAVHGTVNDLAVGGARPLYLSCGLIIEEGLPIETLRRVIASMQAAATEVSVAVVTGDTKVVPRGAADKLFINTAGVGVIASGIDLSAQTMQPGDKVIVSGPIGDHGAAIADARGDLGLESSIESDCQPLHELVAVMLAACPEIRCLRDATRGGLATVANEFARAAGCCLWLEESAIPVREQVRGLCEILGFDPLYLANEGKLVAVVPADSAADVIDAMRSLTTGRDAAIIGEVRKEPSDTVVLSTFFGGDRILDLLVADQLPRIC